MRLSELEKKHDHEYSVSLHENIEGQGNIKFRAAFEPLPYDDVAMRAAYQATGRMVPTSLNKA